MTFAIDYSSHKIWATSLIFQQLPIVNNRPKVENPPNLVTVALTHVHQ
jgi:hypothetical protein